MAKTTAWIGLGSNLGDGLQQLQRAWLRLGELPGLTPKRLSSPWYSAPVGMVSDNWFTNAVGELSTELSPLELLAALKVVEQDFGRVYDPQITGYQDRTLDLDLLYLGEHGERVVKSHDLIVPHPLATERLFVLLPLAELAPDLIDPHSGRSVALMAEQLQAEGGESPQRRQWKEEQ